MESPEPPQRTPLRGAILVRGGVKTPRAQVRGGASDHTVVNGKSLAQETASGALSRTNYLPAG